MFLNFAESTNNLTLVCKLDNFISLNFIVPLLNDCNEISRKQPKMRTKNELAYNVLFAIESWHFFVNKYLDNYLVVVVES